MSWSTTPHSTVTERFSGSMARILFILAVARTIPPRMGTEPPETFVPPPRGVTGMRFSLASFRISATCAVAVGKTTTSGAWFQLLVAS